MVSLSHKFGRIAPAFTAEVPGLSADVIFKNFEGCSEHVYMSRNQDLSAEMLTRD